MLHAYGYDDKKTYYTRCYTAKFVFQPQNHPLEFYAFTCYVTIYSNNIEDLKKNFSVGPQHGLALLHILNSNFYDVLSSSNSVSRIFNPRFFHAETDITKTEIN